MAQRLLILNGSVRATSGNSARLIEAARRFLPVQARAEEVTLATYSGTVQALAEQLRSSDALLFVTGVYWGSWGSPLQRFLEVMSGYELSDCFLGKPAGALVSMDSVGGMEVAHRLLGAFNLFGCSIPPLATVVISRAAALAGKQPGFDDFYRVEDIEVLVHNLLSGAALAPAPTWSRWPMEPLGVIEGPYPQSGALSSGLGLIDLGEAKIT